MFSLDSGPCGGGSGLGLIGLALQFQGLFSAAWASAALAALASFSAELPPASALPAMVFNGASTAAAPMVPIILGRVRQERLPQPELPQPGAAGALGATGAAGVDGAFCRCWLEEWSATSRHPCAWRGPVGGRGQGDDGEGDDGGGGAVGVFHGAFLSVSRCC